MLDIKINDSVVIDMPLDHAFSLCREVVADLGWRILNQSSTSLHCKELAVSAVSFNWPAEVEIVLSPVDESQTSILLKGAIFGFGPIQKSHLQGQMGNLRNRIELALKNWSEKAPHTPDRPLSSELEKLALLYKEGILTEEEFRKAKQRLLERGAI